MQYTLKNKTEFSPLRIAKGEQLYSVAVFIDEMRKVFLWDDPDIDKDRLNIFIDHTIYHVADEVEKEDSELLNYKPNDAETPVTNVFDMQHVEKWGYLKYIFCLYAHFLAMKLYRGLNDGIEHPDTEKIISKFTLAYRNFCDDRSKNLSELIAKQHEELNKLVE